MNCATPTSSSLLPVNPMASSSSSTHVSSLELLPCLPGGNTLIPPLFISARCRFQNYCAHPIEGLPPCKVGPEAVFPSTNIESGHYFAGCGRAPYSTRVEALLETAVAAMSAGKWDP
ncbi:Hypothetical predicted protein [Podarcis lilfordi]|uniref:Uncharacterized protein n=1 Tax=Podarcis lilfordi TaxID=74358 RepID=A0AA35LFD9_9SAUR|nr:Hypothetical predicted protein [Podarcis lilfordi]